MARIALLPGDGVGPEVVQEAVKVVQDVSSHFAEGKKIDWRDGLATL